MMWLAMFWISLKKAGKAGLCQGQRLTLTILAIASMVLLPGQAIAAPASLQLGLDALQQQDFATAVEYFDQAIQQHDSLEVAYGQRCLAHLMLNQPEQSVQDCSAAIAVNPAYPKLRFYRGLAHYRLSQYTAAVADLTQHLRAQPDDARAYYNCGLAKFAQGDVSAAIADYHQALTYAADLNPVERSNLYNDLGVAYLASGSKPAETLLALDQAVALDASDTRAYFNRGCACHEQGHYAAALRDFDRVIALNPHHAETYFNRGAVKQQLGNLDGAITDYQTAFTQFQQQGNLDGAQRAKLRLQQMQQPRQAIG